MKPTLVDDESQITIPSWAEDAEDDAQLAQFMRMVVPQILPMVDEFNRRLASGRKLSVMELWRFLWELQDDMALLWAGHSPRQQPAFEEKIAPLWLLTRRHQRRIYDLCLKELERRGRQ